MIKDCVVSLSIQLSGDGTGTNNSISPFCSSVLGVKKEYSHMPVRQKGTKYIIVWLVVVAIDVWTT